MGMARLSYNREAPTRVGTRALKKEKRRRLAAKRAAIKQRKAMKCRKYEGIANGAPNVVLRREPNVNKVPKHQYAYDRGNDHRREYNKALTDCYTAVNK